MGKCSWAGFQRVVKLVLTFVFSHIGLCASVVGYSIAGAFLFRWLEQKYVNEDFYDSRVKRNNCLEELYNITERTWMMEHHIQWREEIMEVLVTFEVELKTAVEEGQFDQFPEAQKEQWNIIGALFYCVTVITTIGYGHIAPRTWEGKMVTIVYAIIGIPLMLLCLTNIGDSMASTFRFSYRRLCCCCCCIKKKKENLPAESNSTLQTSSNSEPRPWTPPPVYKPKRHNMIISPPISATIHRGSDQPLQPPDLQNKAATAPSTPSSSRSPSRPTQIHMQSSASHPYELDVNQILSECAAYSKAHMPGLVVSESCQPENRENDQLASHASVSTPSPSPSATTPSPSTSSSPLSRDAPSPWSNSRENGSLRLTVPVVMEGTGSGHSTRPTSPSGWVQEHSPSLSARSNSRPSLNQDSSASVTWALPLEEEERPRHQRGAKAPKATAGKTLVVYNTLSGDALLQQSKIARKMALMNKVGKSPSRGQATTVFTDPVSGQAVDGDMLGLSYRPIETEPSDKDTRVPIPLVLAFVAGYLCIGALLFKWLEGWDLMDSAYFCFITLSTIGFGDFVPGKSLGYETPRAQIKLVASSLYLLLGLAVLAMSFNLVQEEVVLKCKAFAQYIGLMKD